MVSRWSWESPRRDPHSARAVSPVVRICYRVVAVKEEVVDVGEVWWLLKPLVERCDGPDPLAVVAGIEKLGPNLYL